MFLVALRMCMSCAYIRFFPAELAVQNVVDVFASIYRELVDTTFSYLLLAARCPYLKGLYQVVTLRVLPTAFYTTTFHVYIFVYSRFFWADFGGIFSCLAYIHVPTSAFFLRNLRCKM